MVNHAKDIKMTFLSANRLWNRKSLFKVNNWILDSGAFTEISKFGYFRHSVKEYAELINKFKVCGQLECAVTQDMMCEPFVIKRTGLTIKEHQKRTIERYDELIKLTNVTIMPVLQGFAVNDYIEHLKMYGTRLLGGMRVGVGSVCKRNSKPLQVRVILDAIKKLRPDLNLHGFGLKITALQDGNIRKLLYSSDSMSWSYAARREGRDRNGLKEAQDFYCKVIALQNSNYGFKRFKIGV
jgi:hypothetical protein